MEETLRERCYYVLKGLFRELFEKDTLPQNEPQYKDVIRLIIDLLDSRELDPENDKILILKIRSLLMYGDNWEQVYRKIIDRSNKYENLLNEIIRLLELLEDKNLDINYFSLDIKLEEDLEFFKVLIPGFQNGVDEKLKEIRITKFEKVPKLNKLRSGDPRVYLHNPLREEVVFVKKRLLKERFPNYIMPFMKKYKIKFYLCSIEKMISYILNKYNSSGSLNLIAVSKTAYIKTLDDRTMFIVLKKISGRYIPLEIAYGGIDSKISLVFMQTFAFTAGITPDEIQVLDFGEAKIATESLVYKALDPNAIALIGWWDDLFKKVIELYFEQNFRIVIKDFIFYAVDFMMKKKLRTLNDRITLLGIKTNMGGKSDIIKDASKLGLSIENLETEGNFDISFRTRFYDLLQNSFSEGYVEYSPKEIISELFKILEFTVFYEDNEKNRKMKEEEIGDLFLKIHLSKIEKDIFLRQIIDSNRPPLFNLDEYRGIKKYLLNIEAILGKNKQLIKSILSHNFKVPLMITIGKLRMQLFPHIIGRIEDQTKDLINQGIKTFLYYGTTGGVKNIPVESLVIPEVIYVYPRDYVRIDPSMYLPIAIENILLDKSNSSYFNTDNFYKTHHVFMAATYQEHAGFFRKLQSLFSNPNVTVSIDMDLAPIAELCLQKDIKLGSILYTTDVLAGEEQRSERKGFYARQIILSLFRAWEGKKLLINNQDVEVLFNIEFRKIMNQVIKGLLSQ